jgi:hypothetical protein
MKWAKRSSAEAVDEDPNQLWGELIGIDDRTDHERTFTVTRAAVAYGSRMTKETSVSSVWTTV